MSTSSQEKKPLIYFEEHRLKEDPQDYGMADEFWDFEMFKQHLQIIIVRRAERDLEFDMIGAPPALANALRRIMLSEVPSMAIEKVYIYNNTTIIQDEVLAHRLGLIPLKADPRNFQYKIVDSSAEGNPTDTLEFELKVKCTRDQKEREALGFDKSYSVLSEAIKWIPKGKQAQMMKEIDVGPIERKILIAKMRPGHELDLKLFAVKGIGQDHAKFSPVATAWYRLLPQIKLKREVQGKDARLLQKCFSPGVIEVDSQERAYVKDARYDSCSRNVYRYPHLAEAVELSGVRDHFIFTVESLGALDPVDIFIEAVKCLKQKCEKILDDLSEFQ